MECRCGCLMFDMFETFWLRRHKPKGFTAEGTISCARLVRRPWKVGILPFNGKNTVIWRGTAKPDPSVNIYEGWVCKAQCANQVPSTRRSFANSQPDPSPLLLFTLDQHILCCASDDQCDSMWHAGSHEKLVMIIWDADENVVRLLFPLREDAGYCSASASWFCFFYVTYIIIYNICITIYEILYNICI